MTEAWESPLTGDHTPSMLASGVCRTPRKDTVPGPGRARVEAEEIRGQPLTRNWSAEPSVVAGV